MSKLLTIPQRIKSFEKQLVRFKEMQANYGTHQYIEQLILNTENHITKFKSY